MERFSADRFYGIACSLEELKCRFKSLTRVEGQHVANFAKYFSDIGQQCKGVGLIQSSKAAIRAASQMKDNPAEAIKHHLKALTELIQSEMEEQLFLWVPSNRAAAYSQIDEPFFGFAVYEKFKLANYDVEEAGKCFACARWTASVMHAMRVLEHGLAALCRVLKLPFGEGTWKRSIERIEKKIAIMDSTVKQKASWRTKRQFYAEAAKEFRYFKDAWRNHACHGRAQYDEEQAEKIISHTRDFMRVLSTRLREPKITRP